MAKKEEKLYWWKWQQGEAAGWYGDWQYTRCEAKTIQTLEEYLDSIHVLSTHSELYRGIRGCKVARLPQYVIDEKLDDAIGELKSSQLHLKEMLALRKRWYGKKQSKCFFCKGTGKRKMDTNGVCFFCKGKGTFEQVEALIKGARNSKS
jgi:hypothetical protein